MISMLITLFCLGYEPAKVWADTRVRRVQVQNDQIVTVKTSLGIATIIQVPDRPNSIVVGDQSAFKVEYLDQAITIKPLHGSAKSNLYVYTDYQRYNVQLVTTHESASDYVVYLDEPKEKIKSSPISWKKIQKSMKNENLFFEIKRIAKTKDNVLLVEFEVTSSSRGKFKPEWIWLSQNGKSKPIHSLALSAQDLMPDRPIKGLLQILSSDLAMDQPLKIELRMKKTTNLVLPKVSSWK